MVRLGRVPFRDEQRPSAVRSQGDGGCLGGFPFLGFSRGGLLPFGPWPSWEGPPGGLEVLPPRMRGGRLPNALGGLPRIVGLFSFYVPLSARAGEPFRARPPFNPWFSPVVHSRHGLVIAILEEPKLAARRRGARARKK